MTDINRINRGLQQRMFLIEYKIKNIHHFQFTILGNSCKVYNVIIKKYPTCTCPDYKRRHRVCKHICFIIGRVLKSVSTIYNIPLSDSNLELLYKELETISQNVIANQTICDKYKYAISKKNKDKKIERKPIHSDDCCPICFEEFNIKEKIIYCKLGCGNNVHKTCFDMWIKAKGPTCVLCRSHWYTKTSEYIEILD